MNPISVGTNWIVGHLEFNKDAYDKSFGAIVEAWKALDKEYQEEYRRYAEKIANQTLEDDAQQPCPPEKPINRTKTYQFFIDYLESDHNKEQTLAEHEYRRFIKDEWEWMSEHLSSLSYYLDAASAGTVSASTLSSLSASKKYYDSR